MDRRAWQATVHGIAKSQTQLCDYVHVHVHPCKEIFVFTGNLVSYKAYHMAQCWGPASAGSRGTLRMNGVGEKRRERDQTGGV